MSIKIYVKYVKNNRDFHTTKLNLPTGNLDTAASHDVIGLLKVLARQYQQTIILITHDGDIAQMADRTVRIEDGKIRSFSGVERALSGAAETGQGRRLSGKTAAGKEADFHAGE